uniref:helix-turn-helix transcriptional regulator n=1 Tax=Altererythrobacter segetis TaxID=1104773 RepID=UPI00140A19CC|nr:helix-turn-helix transcriptional regulator [Altererythrobacter segetis]
MAKANNKVVNLDPHGDYPLANSEATRMLAAGLEHAAEDKGWSQRTIAKMLNYRASVVLSHMALGRVPIPIDRALQFARLLGMDTAKFLLAVLEQRHPEIDFVKVLGATAKT